MIGATENLPVGPRGQARRHRARQVRRDDRGQQHRRRGPARAGRLPRPRDRPRRRAARRPRDADRRDRRRARRAPTRACSANDDAWASEILAAGERTGELVWRLPLHAEYAKLIEGRYGDIVNSPADRGAGGRSPPPSSCTASPATSRGRTSTSPAPPTTTASPTRPRAAPAGACACSSSSPAANRARPGHALNLKRTPTKRRLSPFI